MTNEVRCPKCDGVELSISDIHLGVITFYCFGCHTVQQVTKKEKSN